MIFFPIIFGLPWEVIWGNLHPSVRRLARFNRLHGKVTDRAAAMLLLPLLQYFTGACDLDIQQYQYLILMEHLPWESSTAKILCTMKLYHISTNTASSIITDGTPCHSLLLLLFNIATIVVFCEYNSNPPFNIWSTLPIVMRVFYHRCCFCHFQYHCDVF